MTSTDIKPRRTRAAVRKEPVVVYHGIKIEPMSGKRSPLAQYIHDALRVKSEPDVGAPARP